MVQNNKSLFEILLQHSLSVVQSYFVYWARIESSTVSQQTQNGSAAVSSVAAGTIKPTTLQEPTDVIGEFTAGKGMSIRHVYIGFYIVSHFGCFSFITHVKLIIRLSC